MQEAMQEAMQEGMQGCRIFAMHCENFARIAKISQGLQKFLNHSENFAIPAKFSLCTFFLYHTEISLS